MINIPIIYIKKSNVYEHKKNTGILGIRVTTKKLSQYGFQIGDNVTIKIKKGKIIIIKD